MRRSAPSGRLASALSLARIPGGFQLKDRGRVEITARSAPDGWLVEKKGKAERWFLRKNLPEGGGFVLHRGSAPDGEVAARSHRIAGVRSGWGAAHLVTEDGRLFVIESSWSERRVILRSWETPGAYWNAHPSQGAWRVTRTIAGLKLADADALLLLLAAELADAERPLAEDRPVASSPRRVRRDARRA